MDLDDMLIMVGLLGLIWLMGYKTVAVVVFGLFMIVAFIMRTPSPERRVAEGIKVQGAEMLEPIVIETVKKPPFRIPRKMDLGINPTWGAKLWREKLVAEGLAGFGGALIKLFGGRKH